jgi:hypothetical protein
MRKDRLKKTPPGIKGFGGKAGSGDSLVFQRLGRTKSGAGGISAAQVAFDNLVVDFIHKRTAERTGGDAGPAFDAAFHIPFNGAGLFISPESVKHARPDAGGIVALKTGHRNILIRGVSDRIDTASTRFLISGVSEGAGQLAGATAGA